MGSKDRLTEELKTAQAPAMEHVRGYSDNEVGK